MCLTLPTVLVSVMGLEKIIPTWDDFEVFLQLLPRSSTAERMNPYTSFWTGVAPGDGPQEFHLVLLDNGRTKVLADPVGRQALNCIRCSACLNICPVYERTGGHAYNSVYPGPIGAILTPQLAGVENAGLAPLRLLALRGLLRRLPGEDQHPRDPGPPPGQGRPPQAGQGGLARPREPGHEAPGPDLRQPPAVRAGPEARPARPEAGRPRRASSSACPARSPAGPPCATSTPWPSRPSASGGGPGHERRPSRDPPDGSAPALADIPAAETPADVPVARDYLTDDATDPEERVARFVERVDRVPGEGPPGRGRPTCPGRSPSACAARGVRTLVVPADLPEDWLRPGVDAPAGSMRSPTSN